jgi:hypothetical protein
VLALAVPPEKRVCKPLEWTVVLIATPETC